VGFGDATFGHTSETSTKCINSCLSFYSNMLDDMKYGVQMKQWDVFIFGGEEALEEIDNISHLCI
jgi:hypothetical protein